MGVQDLTRIEEKLDRTTAGAVAISDNMGGIAFTNMAEVMEFSKLMSLAGTAVPKHLRGNPGGCLAVTIQALEWRSSPFAVANKSYEVNDRIAYEAQLVHAVIEARAPLKERLRYKYDGEGPTLKCTVIGHFKGETDPVDLETPMFKDLKVKNSPLWTSDPKQQFAYYGARAFARRFCPDVLLGIYTEEELKDAGGTAETAVDITPQPGVAGRLRGKKGQGRGFSEQHVQDATATPASDPTEGETPRQRGDRLLAAVTEPADVDDLQSSISEELPEAERAAWAAACAARKEALGVQKAA